VSQSKTNTESCKQMPNCSAVIALYSIVIEREKRNTLSAQQLGRKVANKKVSLSSLLLFCYDTFDFAVIKAFNITFLCFVAS